MRCAWAIGTSPNLKGNKLLCNVDRMSTQFHTSVTERGSFRDCRRRWYLEVVERLVPKNSVQWNLIFGECVHEALAAYYGGKRQLKELHDAFEAAWKEENETLKDEMGGFYEMGIGDEWLEYKDKGMEMLRHYHTYDRTHKFFDEIIAVNVEERAFVDILSPSGQHIPTRPLLSGRIDLVVKRKDGIWIWDHKTAASAPSLRALDVDDQLTAYCYIWWRISGEVPRGAIYNVLVKEPPHPPKQLKSGELSKDKSQRTTFDLYRQEIERLNLDFRDYEEMLKYLEGKDWNQFFVRDGSQRNEEELYSFEERLFVEFQHMTAAIGLPQERYPNPSQWNCGFCSVISLCQAMEEKNDLTYLKENGYRVNPPRVTIPKNVQSPKWKGV